MGHGHGGHFAVAGKAFGDPALNFEFGAFSVLVGDVVVVVVVAALDSSTRPKRHVRSLGGGRIKYKAWSHRDISTSRS